VDALVAAASVPKEEFSPVILNLREREVLRAVFEGLTNKEIGTKLGISEAYVKALLQQLFNKTGVRSRSQLVRVALENQRWHGIELGS
jgi:DNA-binding CsgD family transcriptional regulator